MSRPTLWPHASLEIRPPAQRHGTGWWVTQLCDMAQLLYLVCTSTPRYKRIFILAETLAGQESVRMDGRTFHIPVQGCSLGRGKPAWTRAASVRYQGRHSSAHIPSCNAKGALARHSWTTRVVIRRTPRRGWHHRDRAGPSIGIDGQRGPQTHPALDRNKHVMDRWLQVDIPRFPRFPHPPRFIVSSLHVPDPPAGVEQRT